MKSFYQHIAKKSIGIILFILLLNSGFAQNGKGVFIGSLANQMPPHISAALEVYAHDKGILIPRMDSAQRIAITPSAIDTRAGGLMVYDTDNKCVYVWRKGYDPDPVKCWCSLCDGGNSGTPGPTGPAGADGVSGYGLVYEWHNDTLCIRVDSTNAPFTCYPLGMGFAWSATGDSLIVWNNQDTIARDLRGPMGPAGADGKIGVDGKSGPGLVYEWHNDTLCVRVDTINSPFTCYPLGMGFKWSTTGDSLIVWNNKDTLARELRGPIGPIGLIGPIGPAGPGLVYEWHNDTLCVRVDTTNSPFTCYPLGMGFKWSTTGDSLIVWNNKDTSARSLRGPTGPTGPIGLTGPKGPAGPGLVYEWHNDTLCVRVDTISAPFTCYPLGMGFKWSTTGDSLIVWNNKDTSARSLRGPTGLAGPIGLTGPKGPAGPGLVYEWHNDTLCVRVDTTNSPFTCYPLGMGFKWSATGDSLIVWNGKDTLSSISLRGPQGIKGDKGLQGIPGIKGDPGAPGLTGADGAPGGIGATGATGATGDTGPRGDIGDTGAQGDKGDPGDKGDTGDTGPVGPEGRVSCGSNNFIVKSVDSLAFCSDIYEDDATKYVGLGTVTPGAKLDINGNLALRVNNDIPQLTTDQHNMNIGTKSFVRLLSDASRNITGIANGVDGQLLIITNIGSYNIVFQNENGASSIGNQFIFSTSADIPLIPRHTLTLIYDSISGGWRDISLR